MKNFYFLIISLLIFNCNNETKKNEPKRLLANDIVDKSIVVSGGDKIKNSVIKFNFRDKFYKAKRNGGKFQLERLFKDSVSEINDILSNKGFQRYVDGKVFQVSDVKMQTYSASVNSVHYFSILPHGLNDKSVNKELIGEEQIKDENYYRVRVTFDQNGGGEDYEDVFVYWINKTTFKLDYLAYSYNEDDDKGMRFREAYNERYIKGLRFVDYNNYKSEDPNINLEKLGVFFENNKLKLLSKIDLENVEVELVNR